MTVLEANLRCIEERFPGLIDHMRAQAESAVTAIARSPKARWAAQARYAESAPPE